MMKQLLLCLLLSVTLAHGQSNTNESMPKLTFTGYKFSNKEAVSGTFKSIEWSIDQKKNTIKEFLLNSSLKIDSFTIDAGNSARNINITNGLFKNWGSQFIVSKIIEVNTELDYAIAEVSIGDIKNSIILQYYQKGNNLVLTGSIDLIQMGFQSAFAALGKRCMALHKGSDGVVKTWSTVDLEILLPYSSSN